MAWTGAVWDGLDPTRAFSYQAPFARRDRRLGEAPGHCPSTYLPPASHTSTTTNLGLAAPGMSASSIALPSGASNGKSSRRATVGAMSAEVTPRCTAASRMWPGPYQSIGKCWGYGPGGGWLRPPLGEV